MSGHPWSEIRRRSIAGDPEAEERIAEYRREIERRLNRPWWRLVNAWDRMRGRHKLD